VTDAAGACGVTRQTVHAWMHRYEHGGLGALADRSAISFPRSMMYVVNDGAELHLFGAASFPGIVGTVSASYPLAVVRLDAGGVSVDIRSRLLKRLLAWFVRQDPASPWWTAEWRDITSVDFGRRSLVLRANGRRGCRFATLTRRRLLPVVDELEGRGVSVCRVGTTLGWFFKSGKVG
jgi:hypothetical protein